MLAGCTVPGTTDQSLAGSAATITASAARPCVDVDTNTMAGLREALGEFMGSDKSVGVSLGDDCNGNPDKSQLCLRLGKAFKRLDVEPGFGPLGAEVGRARLGRTLG